MKINHEEGEIMWHLRDHHCKESDTSSDDELIELMVQVEEGFPVSKRQDYVMCSDPEKQKTSLMSGDISEAHLQKALFQYNETFGKNIESLTSAQKDVIRSIIKRDTIAILPTGSGKSLIYELLPFLVENCIVIVIMPLSSIINQQCDNLNGKSIQLTEILLKNLTVDETCTHEKFVRGEYNYILCHPENVTCQKGLNKVLCNEFYENKNIFIVVDEAHCILEWGEEFRPEFRKIGKLRAVISRTKVLALTATATVKSQKEIASNLLMKDESVISYSPAKENIFISIIKRNCCARRDDVHKEVYEPLLKELLEKGQDFPPTIVYFNANMDWLGRAYEHASTVLGDKLYHGDPEPENARIAMYHSALEKESDKVKKSIINRLQKKPEEAALKIVFSTVALGMGADLRHVQRIVHDGPPKTLEAYVQQIGRAGRDSSEAEAIMLYDKVDIKHVNKEMKDFCSTNECKRMSINSFFGFKSEISRSSHETNCCSVCNPNSTNVFKDFKPLSVRDKQSLRYALKGFVNHDKNGKLHKELTEDVIEQLLCCGEQVLDSSYVCKTFSLSSIIGDSISKLSQCIFQYSK